MVSRQPNPDLTNTLTMLHTAVMHTDKNLRDALDKSVEKLESAGRAAHGETMKEVVDELGRMRANFRDVYNKLNSNGESLTSAVHDVVAQLRTELREVRAVLADSTPAAPPPPADPSSGALAPREASGPESGHTSTTPVTTLTGPDGPPEDNPLHPAIPAQRIGDQDSSPGPALSLDALRQAVREALTDFLKDPAPASGTLNPSGASPAGDQPDVPGLPREAAGDFRQEVGTALEDTRSALASLQQEIAAMRATVDDLRPQPDATAETTAPQVTEEHRTLLKTAARVSSASLLCHRDIWEFITAHAGRHPHFRVPPQVADEGDERIRAALSGRSLIALLISLHSITHTARDGDGDQELTATVYERIEESLTALTPNGQPVTITLDDRTAPAPGLTAPESRTDAGGEPDNPSTPPSSTEQNTDPGEEAVPATR
ncbi:hypothetical protein GCM10023220_71080 [Streptomyces ziwulingensis]|uniref:Uncharacterized protein n=2 Tax=Streptomyces ziwulingensis TaxID=1045501 RepID=A0ABP9D9C2_9ACTN